MEIVPCMEPSPAHGLMAEPCNALAAGLKENGVCACGHPMNEGISIPYPIADARGIGPSHCAIEKVGISRQSL
jgi:hypothetical protein